MLKDARRPLSVAIGVALLSIAWLFGNPPAAAPDEPEHYIRAVSLGRGEILGQLGATSPMAPQNHDQAVLLAQITRSVAVPAGLAAPDTWFCTVQDHTSSAQCLGDSKPPRGIGRQVTYVGSYQPYAYALAAPLTRLAATPVTALYLARLGYLLIALPLLLLAVIVIHEPGSPATMLGVTLALTPMVLFTSAAVSPSAVEVAGAICLWAAIVRLWRRPGDAALAVVAIAISVFAISISRPLGVLWVAFAAFSTVVLLGQTGLGIAWQANRRGLVIAGLATLAGLIPNLAWQLTVLPPTARTLTATIAFLGPSILSIPETIGEAIGVFGWQDTLMPRPWYAVWGLLVVALIAAALTRGRRAELRRLEAILLGVAFLMLLVPAVVLLPTGYAVQGRYLLPALSAVPLVAGEMVRRSEAGGASRSTNLLMAAAAVGVGAVQFVAWYSNAHRYAVGLTGRWLFLADAQWQPPLGWAPWLMLALAGAVAMGAASTPTRPGRRAAEA